MATENSVNVLANICKQKSLYQSYVKGAATRYELVSPYPLFTQEELNMRRKTEILKYNKNANMDTRTSRWRTLVDNKKKRACVNNKNINVLTPTSSSGIPGPVQYINNNANIPLYNYLGTYQTALNYTIAPNLTEDYNVYPVTDLPILQNSFTKVADLVIVNPNNKYFSFNVVVPIGISISGNSFLLNNNSSVYKLVASINTISFQVQYSNSIIAVSPQIINNLSNMTVFLNNTIGDFSASKYLGVINVSNLVLQTLSQFVYSLYLQISFDIVAYDQKGNIIPNVNTNTLTSSVACNLVNTVSEYNIQTNCVITNLSVSSVFPFQLTGYPA
jgi:hypothetical protein